MLRVTALSRVKNAIGESRTIAAVSLTLEKVVAKKVKNLALSNASTKKLQGF